MVETTEENNKNVELEKVLEQNLASVEEFKDADKFTPEELRVIYQKIVDDFENQLKTVDSSVEELEAMEKALNEKQDAWDKEVMTKTYTLAEKIEWKGKTFTRKQIGQKIRAILDKYECDYSYTLGMWELAMWWLNPEKEVDYSTFNSTSRVLSSSGIKFKGIQEWENILVINEYFKQANEDYLKDILHTTLLALRHNAIVDQLTLRKPQTSTESVSEVEAPQEGNIEMVEG